MPFAIYIHMCMYRETAHKCAHERAEKKREGIKKGPRRWREREEQSLKGGGQGARDAREREKDSGEEEFRRGRARDRRGRQCGGNRRVRRKARRGEVEF